MGRALAKPINAADGFRIAREDGRKRPYELYPSYDNNERSIFMSYQTDFKSIRDEVNASEWQARLDLAACYRLVDKYDMQDLIYNHITARIPGTSDHLLINLYGLLYKEITASSLVKIDLEGNILHKPDTDYDINKSGYVIHGAIHRARPEVACVLHTHTRAGMAVSAMKCGLLPLSQTAIRFSGHIGYHDYEGRRSISTSACGWSRIWGRTTP